jgi:DNA-dependent RNA polymerase auxiliary subunit epsilon
MDLSSILNKGEDNRESITEEETQALYMYLSIQFENMNDQQKLLWIEIMKSLDPEFEDYEKD